MGVLSVTGGYIDPELARLVRKIFGPAPKKLHRETCPQCGRRLVNIYRRGEEWKCRKCWEKEGQA